MASEILRFLHQKDWEGSENEREGAGKGERKREWEREEGGIQLKKTNHGFVYSDKNLPSKYHRLFQTQDQGVEE